MVDSRPLVVHVIHHLRMGGLENGLVNLINRMSSADYRHAVVCVEDYSEFRQRLQRPDVDVVALHRSRIGIWGLRRALYALFRQWRPAILHSRNLSGLDALLPARLAGVRRCVHGEHGRDVDELRNGNRKLDLLRKLHSPLVSRYVTVSRDLERYLTDRLHIAPSRITQIYNGVDTDRFAPAAGRSSGLLPPGFADDGMVVFGTVGRAQPIKDQATLIRAFARLRRAHPELGARARLAIVGDGPLLGDLRALAQDEGVAEAVWLPGARDDVPEVLRSFDVFVLPSLSEGISNTILEAMASRLPLLVTAVGGNVELVDDGAAGRWFAPGDADALASLFAAYLSDPALRERHARAARDAALARFSMDAMVNAYRDVYDKLLGIQRDRRIAP